MVFRTAGAIVTLLIGLGSAGGEALAQYYPPLQGYPTQAYPPPQEYPIEAFALQPELAPAQPCIAITQESQTKDREAQTQQNVRDRMHGRGRGRLTDRA